MKKVYLSYKAGGSLAAYLKTKRDVITVRDIPSVDPAIADHPDVLYCRLGSGRDSDIYKGDPSLLGPKYPADSIYNAACVGKYIIASEHISKDLLCAGGLIPVYVRQGYTKCNLVVIDDSHVITEDEGIAKVLAAKTDIKCLLISPGGTELSGYDHGFIGGTSGRIDDEIVFNGDLSAHRDFESIKDFILSCGLNIKYFKDCPLTDIGSIVSE